MSLLIFSLATLAAPMFSAPTGDPSTAPELPAIAQFALLDDRQGQRDPRAEQPAGGGRVPPGASDGAAQRSAQPMAARGTAVATQPMADDATIRIFPVKHTPVVTVVDILSQRWGEIARPDVQNNRIIFVGPEKLVPKVAEFIAALDVPSQGIADEHNVELVLVQNRDPRDIVVQLSQTNFRQTVNFSADSARSMILLDGSREEIDQLKKLINGLDLPLVTCDVEFIFFRRQLKDARPPSTRALKRRRTWCRSRRSFSGSATSSISPVCRASSHRTRRSSSPVVSATRPISKSRDGCRWDRLSETTP
ncbi:MAG: hypothetical protein IPK83_08150 [Planctomycetes bacterium]|nr:hypothetical protein [Planctomycetota bacterium]